MIISIAGLKIKIENRSPFLEAFCQDYRIQNESWDFAVSCTDDEIQEEVRLSPHVYSDRGVYESTCLFRMICRKVLDYDAFFIHSAVVALDGEAYAFLARSGTGKTTHVRLWMEHFTRQGRQPVIVNGDKPIYRFIDDELLACGHPWSGKENWNQNRMVSLRSICFLEQGPVNEIRRLEEGETLDRLFQQLLLPRDAREADRLFGLLDRMIRRIPAYVMRCTISEEAAAIAHAAMSQGEVSR